ncbi:kinase-like domain-containing protein [Thelonectria olida]|uniref:Kinase-like domain-containing protein n=1 Tax=Thelonectria olida TaxID=1576542 RepID=A0A9P8VSG7_9HYPO|nr:kinase-like domain-containing protein [Thelonectria olida]
MLGRNGYDASVPYITRSALAEYWWEDRVREILNNCGIHEHAHTIVRSYLRIFSILVYIGMPQAIGLFTERQLRDDYLPIIGHPADWPDDLPNRDVLHEFHDYQWAFCPLQFSDGYMHKRRLAPRMILPVSFKERLNQDLGGGDAAAVWRVEIDGECNQGVLPEGPVVFKIYHDEETKNQFDTEANTYTDLPKTHPEYITACYGSFIQNGKSTIILEYAPGGTLLDFCTSTNPPGDIQETEKFWVALFKLLHALHFIHNIFSNDPLSVVWSTTHHDIKPENILVFPQGQDSKYDVKLKLADFGLASIRPKLAGAPSTPAPTKSGNRMYTAPECCDQYPVHYHAPKKVLPISDVWALGAVFSETLIWTAWDTKGRNDYSRRRQAEIFEIERLKGSGYDACFHDGVSRLDAVDQVHNEAIQETNKTETLSQAISEVILDYMLLPSKDRLEPIEVYSKFEDKRLKWIKLNKTALPLTRVPRSPTPNSASPTPPQDGTIPFRTTSESSRRPTQSTSFPPNMPIPRQSRDATRPNLSHRPSSQANKRQISDPVVTFLQVYTLLLEKHQSNRTLSLAPIRRMIGVLTSKSNPAMTLPGIQQALNVLRTLANREQLFLIDDYHSMKTHKRAVKIAARVISYYVKEVDPNKMELFFASALQDPHRCSTSSELERVIENHNFSDGYCLMHLCIQSILEQVLKTLKSGQNRSFSIYVLTDAVWEPGVARVDGVIARAVRELMQNGIDPGKLMIQFLRFGDTEFEYLRLKRLDDDLVREYDLDEDYDIVDTKSYDDSVPHVLVGSISPYYDNISISPPLARSQGRG